MIRSLTVWRTVAALLAAITLLLSGCGGSDDDSGGNATWRVLNATGDLASIDVYTDSDKRFSAVAADTVTASSTISSNTYTVKVTSAGSATTLLSGSFSLSKDQHYTGVVWGRNGALAFATLPEDEDTNTISNGSSRVRVYNATNDGAAFDVFLTNGINDLSGASPTVGGATTGKPTAYRDLAAGSYRLRVTQAGTTSSVRLDVPTIVLGEKQYATIIITPGSGGVLLNASLLVQQGAYTAYKNLTARMRVIAGADAGGVVSVALNGTPVGPQNLPSPPPDGGVPPYSEVAAGSPTVDVSINGTTVSSAPLTLGAGGDYTLLVYGTGAPGQVQLIADDNRLPAAGRYKVRLVNGTAGTSPMNLTVDAAPVITSVAAGAASSFVTGVVPTNNATLQFTVSSQSSFIDTVPVNNPQSQGIYTVFMLPGSPISQGVLLREP